MMVRRKLETAMARARHNGHLVPILIIMITTGLLDRRIRDTNCVWLLSPQFECDEQLGLKKRG